ncbi:MAG: DnaA regulatory inactivator Hda [Burkholderiales bacterium]|nr:DnaA regulatory inactivator Hda [Burkholderiales bacterium]MDE1928796.1 DnaA regulatory inactivator Hda [Burkholderiales bacterium]MDE2158160.1 DnaA regulatory inactivator Hda [Burkholderiales bacterium]MDE2504888.1 DnaA regulatory inactivator Hda [Burkholderiales bacterium]
MEQLPLAIVPEPQPSFDNFLAGANAAAVDDLRALACTSLPSPPVYLWGPAGCGKTHLLRALVRRCEGAAQGAAWFDAATPLPWHIAPGCALAVIDRCDALGEAAQHAAFALFVEAADRGLQVAAAGRLPPVDLALRDDLRTRLGWGPVYALQPLDDELTRAALLGEAWRRGIALPDEVVTHLLTHFPRDLGHLMHLIDRLDRYALAQGRRLTVPLLRRMLADQAVEAAP